MLFADTLYNESNWLWTKLLHTMQTSPLFWLAAGVALIVLLPNTVYAKLFAGGKFLVQKYILKVEPTPNKVTVKPKDKPVTVSPEEQTLIPAPTTAEQVKTVYDDFRKGIQSDIIDLEAQLAAKREELLKLDKIDKTATTLVTP